MSIIYQAINKNDQSMQDKADKAWINDEVEEGFNVNRSLVEDYDAHYAVDDEILIIKRIITATAITCLFIAIYLAIK